MDELVLNHQIAGDGPPLLLVHGFGISFNIWKELVPLLCQYFTLVIIELPGIGKSSMPPPGDDYLCAAVQAVERVRRAREFETWNVLGYSTGSRIAEAYVRNYANHVSQAVFLCPMKVENFKLLILRLSFWVDSFIPTFIPWMMSSWRLKFLIFVFGFSLHPDSHIDDWQTEIGLAPIRVLKETAKMMIPVGTRPFSVPVPFSLIWGDTDIVPIKPRKPEGRDHFIHANHAAPILAPVEISEIVINFLDKS
jgi:pimeloyl-ACP methyl ester carboxylesterase